MSKTYYLGYSNKNSDWISKGKSNHSYTASDGYKYVYECRNNGNIARPDDECDEVRIYVFDPSKKNKPDDSDIRYQMINYDDGVTEIFKDNRQYVGYWQFLNRCQKNFWPIGAFRAYIIKNFDRELKKHGFRELDCNKAKKAEEIYFTSTLRRHNESIIRKTKWNYRIMTDFSYSDKFKTYERVKNIYPNFEKYIPQYFDMGKLTGNDNEKIKEFKFIMTKFFRRFNNKGRQYWIIKDKTGSIGFSMHGFLTGNLTDDEINEEILELINRIKERDYEQNDYGKRNTYNFFNSDLFINEYIESYLIDWTKRKPDEILPINLPFWNKRTKLRIYLINVAEKINGKVYSYALRYPHWDIDIFSRYAKSLDTDIKDVSKIVSNADQNFQPIVEDTLRKTFFIANNTGDKLKTPNEFKQYDWENKINDTNLGSHLTSSLFKDRLIKQIGEDKFLEIENQIDEICFALNKGQNKSCVFPKNFNVSKIRKGCFNITAMDLIINNKYQVKFLETNNSPVVQFSHGPEVYDLLVRSILLEQDNKENPGMMIPDFKGNKISYSGNDANYLVNLNPSYNSFTLITGDQEVKNKYLKKDIIKEEIDKKKPTDQEIKEHKKKMSDVLSELKNKIDNLAKLKTEQELIKQQKEKEKREKRKDEELKLQKLIKEKAEKEAKEKAEKEAKEKAEKEAKEKAEKEAKEKAEKEAKEKSEKLEFERLLKEKADRKAKELKLEELKRKEKRLKLEELKPETLAKLIKAAPPKDDKDKLSDLLKAEKLAGKVVKIIDNEKKTVDDIAKIKKEKKPPKKLYQLKEKATKTKMTKLNKTLKELIEKIVEIGYIRLSEREFLGLLKYHDYKKCNKVTMGICWRKSNKSKHYNKIFSESEIKTIFKHFGYYKTGNMWLKVHHSRSDFYIVVPELPKFKTRGVEYSSDDKKISKKTEQKDWAFDNVVTSQGVRLKEDPLSMEAMKKMKKKLIERTVSCSVCSTKTNIEEWNEEQGDDGKGKYFCNRCIGDSRLPNTLKGQRKQLYELKENLKNAAKLKDTLEAELLDKKKKVRELQVLRENQKFLQDCKKCKTVENLDEWEKEDCPPCVDKKEKRIPNDLKTSLLKNLSKLKSKDEDLFLEEERKKRLSEEALRLEKEASRLNEERKRRNKEKKQRQKEKKRLEKERKAKEAEKARLAKEAEDAEKARLAEEERKAKEAEETRKAEEEISKKLKERQEKANKRQVEFGEKDIKKINKKVKKLCNDKCSIIPEYGCEKCLGNNDDEYINNIYNQNCNTKCKGLINLAKLKLDKKLEDLKNEGEETLENLKSEDADTLGDVIGDIENLDF